MLGVLIFFCTRVMIYTLAKGEEGFMSKLRYRIDREIDNWNQLSKFNTKRMIRNKTSGLDIDIRRLIFIGEILVENLPVLLDYQIHEFEDDNIGEFSALIEMIENLSKDKDLVKSLSKSLDLEDGINES